MKWVEINDGIKTTKHIEITTKARRKRDMARKALAEAQAALAAEN